MNILIVGAGIGGLTAAIALGKAGHAVTLIEREAEFAPVGAGIVLAPNASRALESLGVDLASRAQRVLSLDVLRADGAIVNRVDTSRLAGQYGPTWAIARPRLHEALAAALPGSVALRMGTAVTKVQPLEDRVDVDGESFDLVIGADGLRSEVRTQVVGPVRYRYSGVTCYRGLARNPGIERALEMWAGKVRIGAVPLRGDQLYYFFVVTAPARAPALQFPSAYAELFGRARGEITKLRDVLDAAPPLHHDLDELDTPVWGVPRVLLLGDAAHGMTPNQGQGAAMAIEDALTVRNVLEEGAEHVLPRYVAARHARVRSVQLDSRRLGAVAQLSNPLAMRLRNSVMQLLPTAASDAQYRKIVQPGLDLVARPSEALHAPASAASARL